MLPIIPKKQFLFYSDYLQKKFTLVPFNQAQQSILLEVNSAVGEKDQYTETEIRQIIRDKLVAIKQVISECVVNDSIDNLPYFVIEEMFLLLTSRSIGEEKVLNYVCKKDVDGVSCDNKLEVVIDFTKISANVSDDLERTIIVHKDEDSEIGVTMKFMTLDDMIDQTFRETSPYIVMLESIFDQNGVYDRNDSTEKEIEAFFDSISPQGLKDLKEKFFDKMPVVEYKTDVVCSKCKTVHPVHLKGLNDFLE